MISRPGGGSDDGAMRYGEASLVEPDRTTAHFHWCSGIRYPKFQFVLRVSSSAQVNRLDSSRGRRRVGGALLPSICSFPKPHCFVETAWSFTAHLRCIICPARVMPAAGLHHTRLVKVNCRVELRLGGVVGIIYSRAATYK